jgi:hypothetical protein
MKSGTATKQPNPYYSTHKHGFESLPNNSSTCRWCDGYTSDELHCTTGEQPQETAGEHNPLPWYVKDGKGIMLGSSGKKDSIFICDRSAGTWVAELPAGKESQANAEFIVTAVNSHDDLIAALEQFVDASREQDQTALAMRIDVARQRAERALAKARGRGAGR